MAEKELESVKKIQQSDLDRFNNSTEDLTERIRRLERERDALLHKIES
jgi:uncharacterized protein YoxC